MGFNSGFKVLMRIYAVVYILYLSSIITVLEQWVFNGEISVEILFACVILNPS